MTTSAVIILRKIDTLLADTNSVSDFDALQACLLMISKELEPKVHPSRGFLGFSRRDPSTARLYESILNDVNRYYYP